METFQTSFLPINHCLSDAFFSLSLSHPLIDLCVSTVSIVITIKRYRRSLLLMATMFTDDFVRISYGNVWCPWSRAKSQWKLPFLSICSPNTTRPDVNRLLFATTYTAPMYLANELFKFIFNGLVWSGLVWSSRRPRFSSMCEYILFTQCATIISCNSMHPLNFIW